MFCIRLPGQTRSDEFESTLAEICTFVRESSCDSQWRFYDTFDWRLYKKSYLLRYAADRLQLIPFSDSPDPATPVGSEAPIFAWDMPAGSLRCALEPLLKARALIVMADVFASEVVYRVLNKDEKTVARIVHTAVRPSPDLAAAPTVAYLTLRPLRGYDAHGQRLAKALSFGDEIPSLYTDIFHSALEATGRVPGSYSAKLDFRLDKEMRSDEATRVILRRLLETMRANEPGIREDIDIEFVHEYRVAIRRTRSALSQIRGVFPVEKTEHFKTVFRELGQRTNQLRDLDVYLLAEPTYRAMLPDALKEDIGPLFDLLRTRRVQALRDVVGGLDTPDYERTLSQWEEFINQPGLDDPTAPNAGIPVHDLARQRIYKRYRRILKEGTYILDHTEDELLHALRIDCKKLRYLLEFFASLFPRRRTKYLIKELKRLQENLGDFNDLTVQQAALLSLAEELPDGNPSTRAALVATGALVETLSRRQGTVKANFATTFSRFASPANQKEYRALFKPKAKKARK